MKKGVWNVENPLALSELFSDGVFLIPISGDEGAMNTESTSTDPETQQVTSEKANDLNAASHNSKLNNEPESREISPSGSNNTAAPNSNEINPTLPTNPTSQSSHIVPNAPTEGDLNSAPLVNVKLPKWEGVFIVNLYTEENQFEPLDVIKKIMQAIKLPGVEINAQTVKFIPLAKETTALSPEILEHYVQHFVNVRIVFWVKSSSLESNFKQLNHPRILMVDMPSVMVSSDNKKRNSWSTIKTFFGM